VPSLDVAGAGPARVWPPAHSAARGCISLGNAEITVALHSSVLACSFLTPGTARGGWQTIVRPRGGASGKAAPVGWKTCVPAWQAEGWAQGSKMRACLRGQVRAAVAGVQSWCACYMRARAEPTLTCLAARRTCTCGRSTEDGTRRTAHDAQRAAMARPIAMAPELAPAPPAQPHHPHHPLPHVSTEASADYRDGNDAHARLVGSGVGVRVGVPKLGRRGWGPPTRAGGGAWPPPHALHRRPAASPPRSGPERAGRPPSSGAPRQP